LLVGVKRKMVSAIFIKTHWQNWVCGN